MVQFKTNECRQSGRNIDGLNILPLWALYPVYLGVTISFRIANIICETCTLNGVSRTFMLRHILNCTMWGINIKIRWTQKHHALFFVAKSKHLAWQHGCTQGNILLSPIFSFYQTSIAKRTIIIFIQLVDFVRFAKFIV